MTELPVAPSRRPSRLVALAAVLIVATVGFAILRAPVTIGLAALRCGSGDGVAPERPPTGSFEPSVTAPRMASNWADDVTLEGVLTGGSLQAVAARGEMAVAVGRSEEGGGVWRPLIVHTLDGRHWRRSEISGGSTLDGDIVAVVAGGPGWVAVGSVFTDDRGGSAGAIWWSEDGRSWSQAPLQPVAFIHSVSVGPSGFWAVGSPADGSGSLGTSTDGITWTWRDPGIGDFGNLSLVWAGDEWIASGAIPLGGDELLPAVWRSSDGTTWSCELLSTPSDFSYGSATAVLVGATTTLITGHVTPGCGPLASCAASAASWVADDNGHWVRVEGATAGPWPVVTAADGTFITVNGDGVWHARDGATWERVAPLPEPGGPDAIVVTPRGIVAVGVSYGAGVRPWVGLLPATP